MMGRFLDAGIRSFVNLVEDHEMDPLNRNRPYWEETLELGRERDLELHYHRLPVRDMDVPGDPEALTETLSLIGGRIKEGRAVLCPLPCRSRPDGCSGLLLVNGIGICGERQRI